MSKAIATASAAITGALALTSVAAQTDQRDPELLEQLSSVAEHLRTSFVWKNGSEDPASIPRAKAVARLANSYSGLALDQGDMVILERWARDMTDREGQIQARAESFQQQYCNGLGSGVGDPLSQIYEPHRFDAELDAEVLASFEDATARLSERGRAIVNAHIDNVLVPGINLVEIDYEKLIRATSPEAVIAHLRATCEFKARHSEEEIQEMMQRARARSGRLEELQEESNSTNNVQQQGVGGELRAVHR